EAGGLQFLRHRLGDLALRRHRLMGAEGVLEDAAALMLPEEIGEGLLLADPEIGLCALDRALDLAAMADDAGVSQQALDIGLGETGDRLGLEAGEAGAEGVALPQDGDPGQAGLET